MSEIKSRARSILFFATLAVLACLVPASAFAQSGARYNGVAQTRSGSGIAYAKISVCTGVSYPLVTCTIPTASIYADPSLTIPLSNSFNADSSGNYGFYAAAGNYTVTVTAQNFSGSSQAITLGGSGGTNILPLDNTWTGTNTFNGGISIPASTTFGNTALDAGTGQAVIYVGFPGASDSNTGRSRGNSVADIYTAWGLLPGGAGCAFGGCGGTIKLGPSATWGGPVSGQGLEIIGPSDPNYSSPPSGWLVQKSVKIECDSGGAWDSNAQGTQCSVTGNDANHYGIWLAYTNQPMEFDGLKIAQGKGAVVTGLNSNGVFSSTTSGSTGLTFHNDSFGETTSVTTNGPGVLLGPNSFEITFYDCVFDGNPNAIGGTEAHQGLVLDPEGTGVSSPGLVQVFNSHGNDGGIESNGAGSLYVNGFVTEGQSDGKGAVWFTSAGAGGAPAEGLVVENVAVADATVSTPAVENDGGIPAGELFTAGLSGSSALSLEGPGVISSSDLEITQSQIQSPLDLGQAGFQNGWVYGKRDDVERAGALFPVRFTNAVSGSSCASWQVVGNTPTLTCSIADNAGGTAAAQGSMTGSGQGAVAFLPGSSGVENLTLAVGEHLVGGFWSRSVTANGYAGNVFTPASISVSGTGFALSGGCSGDSVLGDGQWTWNSCNYEVTAIGTNPAGVAFDAEMDSTHTVQVYAPVFNLIPANTLSANEVAAYVNSLRSYDTTCVVGNACGLASMPIQATGGIVSPTATISGLTSGNCVQAGTGGLLTSAAAACGSGGGGLSGMTAGQIPVAATPTTVTSSIAKQGTDTSLLSSGTIAGTSVLLCTDANGGATTSSCPSGSVSAPFASAVVGGTATVGNASLSNFTWTFGLSAGTNPTINFGNNLVTFNTPIQASSLTLTSQNNFTLGSGSQAAASYYQADSGSGTSNTTPAYLALGASPADTYFSYLFPCQQGGAYCESSTVPSADSNQTLAVHGGVNAQTGTSYTIATTDEDGLTTFNNAGAIAVTLACPTGTSFADGWNESLKDLGAGTATITVSGCTITPAGSGTAGTTAAFATGASGRLYSDGTNYQVVQ